MLELSNAAFELVNLPYTILLMLVLVYWLTVILGVLDFEFLDFNVDADIDVDIDIDADADVDGGGLHFAQVLQFFHIGSIPLMIIISFFALFMWTGSMVANHYLGNASWLIALGLFFPMAFISLFLTKYATYPFVKVFQAMEANDDVEVVGKVCTITVATDAKSLGQAEVRIDDMPQIINVKNTQEGTLAKGTSALVISYNKEHNSYLVEAYSQ